MTNPKGQDIDRNTTFDGGNSTPREINEPSTRGHQAAALITALAQLITALTGAAAVLLYRS
ncbi:hypothetical protein [Streptomyces sp. T028]|uniref:hypothetical protein n=1 Tax=Streptomyces sp. T028 TaxID=3394379 RepID=UPI003A88B749